MFTQTGSFYEQSKRFGGTIKPQKKKKKESEKIHKLFTRSA
jgi:hypothetical protein